MSPTATEKFIAGYVVIEALNTWANFSRSFYLSCTISPRRAGGGRVRCAIAFPDFNAAIGAATVLHKHRAKPKSDGSWDRRDEPTWFDPNVLIRTFASIGASNSADVAAGLSSGTRVFVDLPVFRNYFAHRNQRTRAAAMRLAPQYGLPATLLPSEIILRRPFSRYQPLVHEWIDDLRFTVEYVCH
jgi:hypothetical protein